MSSPPPPPLDPQDPRAADPTNPISWIILGGLLLGAGAIATVTLLNSFHSKPTPVAITQPTASATASPEGTPSGAYKLIFEGSGDGTITNPASNRQNFEGATAHQWHLEYYVADGSASAADDKTATISGSGLYRTYDGTGACRESADMFASYPELRTGASADEFLIYPPLGSYVVDATCPAFAAAFGVAKDFTFTIHRGVDRIPIPLQKFDYSQGSPGSAGSQHVTLSWSGLITVTPQ